MTILVNMRECLSVDVAEHDGSPQVYLLNTAESAESLGLSLIHI